MAEQTRGQAGPTSPSLSLSLSPVTPVTPEAPSCVGLPAILACDEAAAVRPRQQQQQQEALPLTALRSVCEQMGRVLQRQETSFREVDACVSRQSSLAAASRALLEASSPEQESSCSQPRDEEQWHRPHQHQRSREELADAVLAVDEATSLAATPRTRSVTGCRPFAAAPVSSCEMTCEEQRQVLAQAQQREPQRRQCEEPQESVSGVAADDAQDVITLQPSLNCLVFDAAATPCQLLSPFPTPVGTGLLVPLKSPMVRLDSIPSVSISPLSRPLSALMESPTFALLPRREGLAPMGTSTPLQLSVQQPGTDASSSDSVPLAISPSPLTRGVGEAGAAAGHPWSASGVIDLSFNRTPKCSLNSSPSHRVPGPASARNASGTSDFLLAHSVSTDSAAHVPTGQERGEATRAPPFSRVPPVQTMRRPPTVPRRNVPLEVSMSGDEVRISDEEPLHADFSGEEFSSISIGEEEGGGEALMTRWQLHQRLFEPSPSRWRSSRGHGARAAPKRPKRGRAGRWDMFSRLRELERIRVSNHEALEERELQSLLSSEANLNPLEASWMESETSESGGSPAGRRRRRRGEAGAEPREASVVKDTAACSSPSQAHDDHAGGGRGPQVRRSRRRRRCSSLHTQRRRKRQGGSRAARATAPVGAVMAGGVTAVTCRLCPCPLRGSRRGEGGKRVPPPRSLAARARRGRWGTSAARATRMPRGLCNTLQPRGRRRRTFSCRLCRAPRETRRQLPRRGARLPPPARRTPPQARATSASAPSASIRPCGRARRHPGPRRGCC
ncbi:uncharacterized protein Tco025E_06161 [Trypanosoma conorhini]|uniref:Uncharacterized protein n=1 Tax=Trypanosoma conorhini TaxID=83891 RepID=A0A3R7MET2_9TRYP|nr:uncharacterized protein Tco025E_06161 [Trypanosoma conorhini]RNF13911.1 hypothetical protein Tco025E_06161 [Trypanosoma conorhini]